MTVAVEETRKSIEQTIRRAKTDHHVRVLTSCSALAAAIVGINAMFLL